MIPMVLILVSGDPSASFPGAIHAGLIMVSAPKGETEAMGVEMEITRTIAVTEEMETMGVEMEFRVEPGLTVAVGAYPVGHRLPLIAQTVKVVVGEELASKIAKWAATVGFATSEGNGGNVSSGHCSQRFWPCSVSIDYL